ncbi:MAG: cytochrome c biogenesis protein CcsA [Elusimicrobia bacterium]|nr:cytochrome c biogenesis protein CcsA [Elusimicrobiota bacterium]
MQKLQALLFDFGFLGTLTAVILYLVYVFSRREGHSVLGHRILFGSALLHAASLAVGLWMESHRPGHVAYGFWSNWFESLSLFSLLIVVVFLGVQTRARLAILGAFVLPWALLLMGLALTQAFLASPRCPFASVEDFLKLADTTRRLPVLPSSVWAAVHVPLLFFSYAAFANAFGIGLAFLIQERQLKTHRSTDLGYRLPSLDEMDRMIARLISAAFPALTMGLGLGIVWAHSAWGDRWVSDPKVLWSIVVWAVYLAYLVLRYAFNWRGRRGAYLSLAGFAFVLVSYMGINYISKAHSYVVGEKQ